MQDLGHLLAANPKKKKIHSHSRDVKESSEMNNTIVLQSNQNTNRLCTHN